MQYIEDKNKRYEKDIIKHLRAHNDKFVGDRITDSHYFYALRNKQVIGRLHTSLFWDWISLNKLYYEDIHVLSLLLNRIKEHYTDYVGMKYYTNNRSHEEAFIDLGFIIGGYTPTSPQIPAYTYLKTLNRDFKCVDDIEIIHSKKIIEKFEPKVHRNTLEQTKDVFFIALDDNKFAGGIHGIIEDDSIYISRLAVHPDYKGNGIGSKLMSMVEDRACLMGLYHMTTGTCSFQAKEFYEKLGFKILFTKENDPKGYESYSLEKIIKKEQDD